MELAFGGSLAAIAFMALLFLLVALPGIIAHLILRRKDREHAFQRAMGLSLVALAAMALVVACLAILVSASQNDVPLMDCQIGPTKTEYVFSMSSFSELLMGPGALSVWLLLAGAAWGTGALLFIKRFSLRGMLVILAAVALLASLPQLVVEQSAPTCVISVQLANSPTAAEWKVIRESLAKDALLTAIDQDASKPSGVAVIVNNVR